MSNSDTPRTDGLEPWKCVIGVDDYDRVPADFARQLERELAAAHEKAHDYYCQLQSERERRVRAEVMLKDLIVNNRANDVPLTSAEENMVAVIAAAQKS